MTAVLTEAENLRYNGRKRGLCQGGLKFLVSFEVWVKKF